ncbi:MAG TPA: hypothetical protein VFX76_17210, partial [Roseiflexaceae bacterium]|nr:hypothetical protein [Roseiflexaceae bacterium]
HWDSRRKGLLAGESLLLDLQRLEKSAIAQNSRYMEIEKVISLARLDPQALLDLKTNGVCQFSLGELLFDRDYPGHYFRIIKSVSISIPAVVGPYQTIKATLAQTGSKTLLSPSTAGVDYLLGASPEMPDSIRADWRANQQIAISRGVEDTGMFELNFNDDRYLPFEGTGAVSTWLLDMPRATNPIDFDSITDVIIRLRYMSKVDNGKFKRDVLERIKAYHGTRLFSLAHEFAPQWRAFQSGAVDEIALTLPTTTFPLNLTPDTIKPTATTLFLVHPNGAVELLDDQFEIAQTGDAPISFTLTAHDAEGFRKQMGKIGVQNLLLLLAYDAEVVIS